MKIKNFSASKDTINKIKRQPTEWEKIFESRISDIKNIQRTSKTQQQRKQATRFKNGQRT